MSQINWGQRRWIGGPAPLHTSQHSAAGELIDMLAVQYGRNPYALEVHHILYTCIQAAKVGKLEQMQLLL